MPAAAVDSAVPLHHFYFITTIITIKNKNKPTTIVILCLLLLLLMAVPLHHFRLMLRAHYHAPLSHHSPTLHHASVVVSILGAALLHGLHAPPLHARLHLLLFTVDTNGVSRVALAHLTKILENQCPSICTI